MRNILIGVLPGLIIVGLFVAFANWVPQVGWKPVRLEEKMAALSPRELARLGEKLVEARGCLVCHVILPGQPREAGVRAPNWADIGKRATVDYLVESLYDPQAKVVEGYAPIMPVVTDPPANLKYEEVVAVVNYLLSLGGTPKVKVGDIPTFEEFQRQKR